MVGWGEGRSERGGRTRSSEESYRAVRRPKGKKVDMEKKNLKTQSRPLPTSTPPKRRKEVAGGGRALEEGIPGSSSEGGGLWGLGGEFERE